MLLKLHFMLISLYILKHTSAQCPTVLNCEHDGKFNTNTCSCDCFPAYSGTVCENANCASEPLKCQLDFSPELCASQQVIRNYCPKLCNQTVCRCGYDSCYNGGFFLASTCQCFCTAAFTGSRCENTVTTAATSPVTTTPACPQVLTCLNGAKQNPSTCKCDCLPAYTGTLCETLNCANEPLKCKDTIIFGAADCADPFVVSYCPVLCGKCATTAASTNTVFTTAAPSTTATTIASVCQALTCQNGGSFDAAKCACSCYPSYSGALCETLVCANEPPVCDSLAISQCATLTIFSYCPRLCGKCPAVSTTAAPATTTTAGIATATTAPTSATTITTASTAVPTTTTATTTITTVTPCSVVKPCVYGNFDYTTCNCKCASLGFSGDLCEVADCGYFPRDDPVCDMLTCADNTQKMLCPQKCLCGATTTPASTISPCNFVDPPECSTINCWVGDINANLNTCQKKCLCCANLQCKNLGEVVQITGGCECECFDDVIYDKSKNCEIAVCNDVMPTCDVDFTLDMCAFDFVSALCPKYCKRCVPKELDGNFQ